MEDAEIAEATSSAPMTSGLNQDDGLLFTDAYASVAVDYCRAAGVYITCPDMQELGTAAVHRARLRDYGCLQ
jgi:hypothetical protein